MLWLCIEAYTNSILVSLAPLMHLHDRDPSLALGALIAL